MKRAFKHYGLLFVLILLSACGPGWTPSTAHKNKDATSSSAKVSRAKHSPSSPAYSNGHAPSADISPLEAHMRARKMVDPADTRKTHQYTTLATAPGQRPPLPPRKPRSNAVASSQKAPAQKSEFMNTLTGLITPEPALTDTPIPQAKPKEVAPAIEAVIAKTINDPIKAEVPTKKPKIIRMSAAEIKRAQDPTLIRAAAKPVRKPHVQKQVQSQVKSAPSFETSVKKVRIGNYDKKTRVVIDLSGPAKFDYDRKAKGTNLRITLKDVKWRAESQQRFPTHGLLERYKVDSGSKGATIIIDTKRPSKLIQAAYLPPNHIYGHRIYFDIAPL